MAWNCLDNLIYYIIKGFIGTEKVMPCLHIHVFISFSVWFFKQEDNFYRFFFIIFYHSFYGYCRFQEKIFLLSKYSKQFLLYCKCSFSIWKQSSSEGGAFRTQSKIYDKVFVKRSLAVNFFHMKAPWMMFDRVLTLPLNCFSWEFQ